MYTQAQSGARLSLHAFLCVRSLCPDMDVGVALTPMREPPPLPPSPRRQASGSSPRAAGAARTAAREQQQEQQERREDKPEERSLLCNPAALDIEEEQEEEGQPSVRLGNPGRQRSWTSDLSKSIRVMAKAHRWQHMWKDSAEEERVNLARARKLFRDLDADGGGTLNREELSKLAKKLDHRWSHLDLSKHFERLVSMEREYRRRTFDSSGALEHIPLDHISNPLSRQQVRFAHRNTWSWSI